MRFGWDFQRSGFNGTSNPGQSAVRRVLFGVSGFGDAGSGYLPRGSRIYWGAEIQDVYYTFGSGRLDQFKQDLAARGYGIGDVYLNIIDGSVLENWATFKIGMNLTVPVDFSHAQDAVNDITGAAWRVWNAQPQNVQSSVLNVPLRDLEGNITYAQAPNAAPPAAPDACATKTGLDWAACKFGLDSTASKFGLGAGAGAALAAAGLLIVGLIVLKK